MDEQNVQQISEPVIFVPEEVVQVPIEVVQILVEEVVPQVLEEVLVQVPIEEVVPQVLELLQIPEVPQVLEVPQVPSRPDIAHEALYYVGVTPTVTTVPYSRKLLGADTSALKTSSNLGWQIIASANRADPFANVPRNANGTTDPVLNSPVDLAFDGEGVDIVTIDGGDSFSISDHPEWLSTKYGTTRFVQEDWGRSGVNFPAITGTFNSVNNGANAIYALFTFPLSFSSNLQFGAEGGENLYNCDEFYGRKITITSGPGVGQSRRISGLYYLPGSYYYGFADPAWDVITTGTAQAGGSNTITLAASSSSVTNFYVNNTISLESGTGSGQIKFITAYDGTTKVATLSTSWTTNPDATSTYIIADVPTTSSTYTIEPFAQPANYYDTYVKGTHGTGTMALAAGKAYGFAKESTLRSLGSHGATYMCGGSIGAFSFSGSTIISTNAAIRTRLSYLSTGDIVIIANATSSSNNGQFIVVSNTDDGTTRTLTVKTRTTFVSEAAISTTTVSHNRYLWGYSQAVELVRLFHVNKVDKTRPTVLVSNLTAIQYFSNIAQVSTVYVNGAFVPVDLNTTEGRTAASDNYFLPFRNTGDRLLGLSGRDSGYNGIAQYFNRTIEAGVIVTLPADNYDFRCVGSEHPAFNDYTCIPGTTVTTTGTAQAGATTTVTLATGASSTDNAYTGSYIKITSGTGSGQNRVITGYVGATKVATVATAWDTNPSITSLYSIVNTVKCYHNRHFYSTIPKATTVGAVTPLYFDNKEYRTTYTVVGPRVDVYAPSDNTATATFDVTARVFWNGTDANSSSSVPYPYNASYLTALFSGTSASHPVTGGVVACMAQNRPWMDSGAARASIQDSGTKDRLYTPSPDVFSNQKSLGGGVNNYLWFPYTHLTDV